MGKKGERGAKDKNAALEEEARNAAKRAEHGEEEYQCTGILEQDFLEICTRAGFQEIPKVIVRPHAHAGITAVDEPDPQAEKEVTNTLAQIQSKYNYFRPSIQVELEHEDPKTTREIFIQSWKIEEKMLTVLAKCLPALSHLQTLRTLVLEGNPLPERSFYKLISEETNLVHLSLRNNDIDDEAAYLIGQALSSLKSSNKTLASINLSCNHITDVGATHIANGLRLNRSLLSLSLAHNRIGDEGALKIAEILAPFALTHVEVVERRRLLLEKETLERSRLPQRHVELKSERPSSHVSNTAIDKLQTVKTTKDTKKKKDKESAKKEKEKEKEEKEKGQGSGGAVVVSSTTSQAKKEDTKEAKQAKKGVERPAAEQKPSRGKGTKSSNKDKRAQAVEVEVAEPTEIVNPLLEQAEHRDGKVFLPGNRVLIYLNLIQEQLPCGEQDLCQDPGADDGKGSSPKSHQGHGRGSRRRLLGGSIPEAALHPNSEQHSLRQLQSNSEAEINVRHCKRVLPLWIWYFQQKMGRGFALWTTHSKVPESSGAGLDSL
nr:PREDICTED: leucine-rich repeat-containing protein 71 isoform X2 [Anolis carolinensis]|eukprot:XP_008120246.1 PREDICTED: leucine-rich repeat-containing protein 71 isoform X2 [Anolis carolinensis]